MNYFGRERVITVSATKREEEVVQGELVKKFWTHIEKAGGKAGGGSPVSGARAAEKAEKARKVVGEDEHHGSVEGALPVHLNIVDQRHEETGLAFAAWTGTHKT